MERRNLNGTSLAKLPGAPKQRTIADVLIGANPGLDTIEKLAFALGIQPVDLLSQSKEQRQGRQDRVVSLSKPYPPTFGKSEQAGQKPRSKTRKVG